MKVHINPDACAGHGQCAVHGPDVYTLDDFGYAQQLDDQVPAQFVDQASRGAAACPEQAIALTG